MTRNLDYIGIGFGEKVTELTPVESVAAKAYILKSN
jgi:hypothetical protein